MRIESNTGDLSAVTGGLRRLAKTLEQVARREDPKQEDQKADLQQIAALDLYRILSRLRSRHGKMTRKTAGKPALISQLD